MDILLFVIIILLCISLVIISIIFFRYQKESTFIPDKDKEFIVFTIDMYSDYAKELDIHSPEQHDKIVEQLERIKNKHFKINGSKGKKKPEKK